MRVSAIGFLSVLLTINILVASPGHGQGNRRQAISLNYDNATLLTVIKSVEEKAGVVIMYEITPRLENETIDISVKNKTVPEVLDIITKGRNLKWTFQNNIYRILDASETTGAAGEFKYPANPSPVIETPPITVRGKIVNEKGEPVVASVMVKGGKTGTTSDIYGAFLIENIDSKAVLIISGVGIETQEVKINNKTEITIPVTTKIAAEEEVIISTGYWTTTKARSTGNISKVTAKEIEKQPVSNPLSALQGRVPGLEITQQTGMPGGSFVVRIRGTNSIGSGNDPLYIVDGVPYNNQTMSVSAASGNLFGAGVNPLNYISPNNIASIEVLKDAAATSIYGSRGSNGVIIITTKKGQPGKSKVDINAYSGISKVAHFADLLDTKQYIEMRKEGYANLNRTPTGSSANDLLVWDTTRYTDWQNELIGGTAKMHDAQISLSGGEQSTQYLISGGYHKETTVFPGNSGDDRISALFSLNNISPNKRLKTTLSVNYSRSKSNFLGSDITANAISLAPNAPALYDSAGNLNWQNQTWANPLQYLLQQYEAVTNNLIGNLSLRYNILNGLEARVNLGYTNTGMDATTVIPKSFYGPPPVAETHRHSTVFANSKFNNWIIEPQLNYKKQFGIGALDIMVGSSFLEQVREGGSITGEGFVNESLMKNLGAAEDRTSASNYYSKYRYASIYGHLNYNLSERYIVDLTVRRDGSSRFGPGKQFANFGAAGVAWIFSNEGFIKNNLSFLSFGKLRASYGTSGNDQIGDYQYLNVFTSGLPYMDEATLAARQLFNANFAWETNKKFELGLEWGIFNDRINGGFSFYRNRSSNQLIGYSLPPTAGFPSILSNFPATVQNAGFEVLVNTVNIRSSLLNWTTSVNFSRPRNKLVAFPDLENSNEYATTLVVGQPLSIRKLYHFTGLDTEAGVFTFEDYNKDGIYDQADKQIVKYVGTNYFVGVQNSLRYKGFSLDFLLQYVNRTNADFLTGTPGSKDNKRASIMDRWQKPGDNAYMQQFVSNFSPATEAYGRYVESDKAIIDASYLRLKNVYLSYNFSSSALKNLSITNATIFIQAQNVLTITNFEGLDPERGSAQVLPPLRTITAGFNLSF